MFKFISAAVIMSALCLGCSTKPCPCPCPDTCCHEKPHEVATCDGCKCGCKVTGKCSCGKKCPCKCGCGKTGVCKCK